MNVKIYSKCAVCSGTGMQPTTSIGGGIGPSIPCTWPGCNATGFYEVGYVDLDKDDLIDQHADILDKLKDIQELLKELTK